MRGLKKLALVIDVSSSLNRFLDLYQLDGTLEPIILRSMGGLSLGELKKLAEEYDQVWFFTDSYFDLVKPNWNLILSGKIRVFNVESL